MLTTVPSSQALGITVVCPEDAPHVPPAVALAQSSSGTPSSSSSSSSSSSMAPHSGRPARVTVHSRPTRADTFLLNMFLSVVLFVCIFLTASLFATSVARSLEAPKRQGNWKFWVVSAGMGALTLGVAVLIQQLSSRRVAGVNINPDAILESVNALATVPAKNGKLKRTAIEWHTSSNAPAQPL